MLASRPPKMTTPALRPLVGPARQAGLFLIVGLLTLALGLTVHHLSSLPSAYTWWTPLRTMKNIVSIPHFPLFALFVYGIGRYAHRGSWDARAIGRKLTAQVSMSAAQKRGLVASLAAGAMAAAIDTWLFPDHTPIDIVAITVFGAQLPSVFRTPRLLLQLAIQSLVAVFVFSALCYTFTVVKALLFIGNDPLDASLIRFETAIFGEPPHRMVARWAAQYPAVVWWCDWVYNRFFHHMILTTLLLLALRRAREQNEYLCALLFCYLLGGPLYHLLPAAGPVFWEPDQFAHLRAQPRLPTNFLHYWLFQNTTRVSDGTSQILETWSYIACMPSLHIAHEVVMTWYARRSRIAFTLSASFTLVTVGAIMVLGWHYFTDAIAGAALGVAAIVIARKLPNVFMPAVVRVPENVAIPAARPVLRPFLDGFREGLASQRGVVVAEER